MSYEDRADVMVRLYGEVCTKTAAARILSCATNTIYKMLDDGRLDAACGGTMVDVRSIARYVAAPAKEDQEARKRTMQTKRNCAWSV